MRKNKLFYIVSTLLVASIIGGCTAAAIENPSPKTSEVIEEEMVEKVFNAKSSKNILREKRNEKKVNEIVKFEAPEKLPDVPIVLKTSSLEKDLKIKFVDKNTSKIVSDAEFKAFITNPKGTKKEYNDHDKDGIIYLKSLDPGTYKVEMIETDGFVVAEKVSCEVKGKIEYKVIEIEDEVKAESEINVSQEDAKYNGDDVDESTKENVKLEDTVESVESTKTEIKQEEKPETKPDKNESDKTTETVKVHKIDGFGNKMYSQQKIDKYGNPMFAVIIAEPDIDHEDTDNDGVCNRCSAKMHVHSYENLIAKEATCTEVGVYELKCSCGDIQEQGIISILEHADENQDNICDTCTLELNATVSSGNLNNVSEDTIKQNDNTENLNNTEFEQQNKNESEVQPLKTGDMKVDVIIYDETTAPIYDESSDPIYEEVEVEKPKEEEKQPEKEPEYKYTGWQTIDGKTYYFDKDGNKVTGTQVIGGVKYTFNGDGVRQGTIGIDVSKFQPSIDWKKVKNAGIDFVIIRCGYRGYGSGVLVEDPYFKSHITGAKAAGLRVGIYFFSQAISEAEAVEEASMAIGFAEKYGIDLPIAIDSEYANGGAGRADGLSKSARTTITKAFCNTVANAGYTPMIYASKSWFSSHLDVSQFPSSYRIWVAHYSDKCGYEGKYDIWQHTSKGKVDGIDGYVDMNIGSI